MKLDLATANDAAEITTLYLASRADAMPYLPRIHSDDSVRSWITNIVLRQRHTSVARHDGRIVGFMSIVGEDLDQLYVLPGHYRQGVGSTLLERAKQLSPRHLRLFTFQRNHRARAFYEAHGFTVTGLNDGSRNQEHEPDILYEWWDATKP